MKTEHKARARNVFERLYIFFYQSTRSKFVRGLIKMAAAEGSFEERFPEPTVRQFPVIYDKGCKDFKDSNKQSQE